MGNKTSNLNEQCAAMRDGFVAGLPEEQQQTIMAAGQRLAESDVASDATVVGDIAADFSLFDTHGRQFQLSEERMHGPIVLSFYRGGWCPFCDLELKALAEREPDIRNLGARLVAVSPELHEQNKAANGDLNLPFPLLLDEGNKVAREYGLVMQVDEAMRPLYLQWGFDLPTFNGDDSWELPLPGTFIIDTIGTVRGAFVNKDYTQRMEPSAIISALEAISKPAAIQK